MTLVEFEVLGEQLHSGFSLAMDAERVPVRCPVGAEGLGAVRQVAGGSASFPSLRLRLQVQPAVRDGPDLAGPSAER